MVSMNKICKLVEQGCPILALEDGYPPCFLIIPVLPLLITRFSVFCQSEALSAGIIGIQTVVLENHV